MWLHFKIHSWNIHQQQCREWWLHFIVFTWLRRADGRAGMLRGCTSPAHTIYKRSGDLHWQRMWLRNSSAFEGITQKTPPCKTHFSPTKNCCSCLYPIQVQESKEQIWPISPRMRNQKVYFSVLPMQEIITHISICKRFWISAVQHLHHWHYPTVHANSPAARTALPKAALQCSSSTPCLPGAGLGVRQSQELKAYTTSGQSCSSSRTMLWRAVSPDLCIAALFPVSVNHSSHFSLLQFYFFAFIFCTLLLCTLSYNSDQRTQKKFLCKWSYEFAVWEECKTHSFYLYWNILMYF